MLEDLKNSKTYFKSIDELYEIGCCENFIDIVSQGEDEIDDLFNEQDMNRIITSVFAGGITPSRPDFQSYQVIAEKLTEAIETGMEISFGKPTNRRDILKLAEDLRENVFVFSGAKSHQEALEMSLQLFDPLGNTRSFADFKKEAERIFKKFREPWLKTEFITAQRMSEGARDWVNIKDDEEIFPTLNYQTIGDSRVRPEHQVLNKISRPVNDPFWDVYFPPNGFRCRCQATQQTSARSTPLKNKKLPDLGPLFDFNVGKKRLIFAPQHPYLRVKDRFKAIAATNFNFPMPARQTK